MPDEPLQKIDLASIDTAAELSAAFLAFAQTKLAKGREGHLELLAWMGGLATDENEEADVAIQLAETVEPASAPAHSVIRLRAEPEANDDEADSIYRYDREALLAALKQARTGKRA